MKIPLKCFPWISYYIQKTGIATAEAIPIKTAPRQLCIKILQKLGLFNIVRRIIKGKAKPAGGL
jgi:hypothetical protein